MSPKSGHGTEVGSGSGSPQPPVERGGRWPGRGAGGRGLFLGADLQQAFTMPPFRGQHVLGFSWALTPTGPPSGQLQRHPPRPPTRAPPGEATWLPLHGPGGPQGAPGGWLGGSWKSPSSLLDHKRCCSSCLFPRRERPRTQVAQAGAEAGVMGGQSLPDAEPEPDARSRSAGSGLDIGSPRL